MKKAQYDLGRKAIYYIIVLFFLTFIFLYLRGVIVGSNEDLYYNLYKAKAELILQQLSTSPDCLAYYDEDINRAYPGIIDNDKLSAERLDCVRFYDGFNAGIRDGASLKQTELKPIYTVEKPVLLKSSDGLKLEKLYVEVANV